MPGSFFDTNVLLYLASGNSVSGGCHGRRLSTDGRRIVVKDEPRAGRLACHARKSLGAGASVARSHHAIG